MGFLLGPLIFRIDHNARCAHERDGDAATDQLAQAGDNQRRGIRKYHLLSEKAQGIEIHEEDRDANNTSGYAR